MFHKWSVCLTGVGYVSQVECMFNRGKICFKGVQVL